MNQNQREGLLVWLHSRAEKWAEKFTDGLQIKVNRIMASFFAHRGLTENAKAITKIDKKIQKMRDSVTSLEKERREIIELVFKACGYEKPRYRSHDIQEGADIVDVITEKCKASIDVGDPRRYNGSLVERYANGYVRMQIYTNNSMELREYILNQLEGERQAISRLNQFRVDMQTKIMLLENIEDARDLVKNIKETFK